jgi:hypothetical protein
LAVLPLVIIVGAFFGLVFLSGQKYIRKYTRLAQDACDPGSWKVSHSYWNGRSRLDGKINGQLFTYMNDDHSSVARAQIFLPYPVKLDYTLEGAQIFKLPASWTQLLQPLLEKSTVRSYVAQTGNPVAPRRDADDESDRMYRGADSPLIKIRQPGYLVTLWPQHPFNGDALKAEIRSLSKLAPLAAEGSPAEQTLTAN